MKSSHVVIRRLSWLLAAAIFLRSSPSQAESNTLSVSWFQEQITYGDAKLRLAQPSLSGSHLFSLSQNRRLQLSWGIAPGSTYIRSVEDIVSRVDVDVSTLSLESSNGPWSWSLGIQPVSLADQTVQPVSIYRGDFAQETGVPDQVFIGGSWEGNGLRVSSAVFKHSPLESLHFSIGQRRPNVTSSSGLTKTKNLGSWFLSVESEPRSVRRWHIEYSHLATDQDNEENSSQLIGSLTSAGPFEIGDKWGVQIGYFYRFRGTRNNVESAMLSYTMPTGSGTLHLATGKRWNVEQINSQAGLTKSLIEVSYSQQLFDRWHLIFGLSEAKDLANKSRAAGMIVSYILEL